MVDIQPTPLPTNPEALSPTFNTQAGIYQHLKRLAPSNDNDEPLLMPFDINGVAAGQSVTLNTDAGIPDQWVVAIQPVVGAKVSIYPGPEASGIPYRLGGGGSLTIPGLNEYLTLVVEVGSPPIIGTIVAVRLYKHFAISSGASALGSDVITTGAAQIKTGVLTAPIMDKGGQVFNTAAFGCLPSNPAAANSAAINAAIAAAAPAGTVYTPSGTYNINGDVINWNLTGGIFKGAGTGATTFKMQSAGKAIKVVDGTSSFQFLDFYIEGNNIGTTGVWLDDLTPAVGSQGSGWRSTMENVFIQNITGSGVNGLGAAVYNVNRAYSFVLRRCTLINNYIGWWVQKACQNSYAVECNIYGNVLSQVRIGDGIGTSRTYHVGLRDCQLERDPSGASLLGNVEIWYASPVEIDGCYFESNAVAGSKDIYVRASAGGRSFIRVRGCYGNGNAIASYPIVIDGSSTNVCDLSIKDCDFLSYANGAPVLNGDPANSTVRLEMVKVNGAFANAAPGYSELIAGNGSPVSSRWVFGSTGGLGWDARIARNVAGTVTDLVQFKDTGLVSLMSGGIQLGGWGTLTSGSGVPNNANGVNGDYYFRVDGTAGTRIYHKEAGVWVATGA